MNPEILLNLLAEHHELFAMEYAPDLDQCLATRLAIIDKLIEAEKTEYQQWKEWRANN